MKIAHAMVVSSDETEQKSSVCVDQLQKLNLKVQFL